MGLSLLTLALSPALGQITWGDVVGFRPPAEAQTYALEQLAKGLAEECFDGVGVDYPALNPDGTCPSGRPKVNQAYVWGLTQAGIGVAGFAGDDLWFGTIANPLCGGAAGVFEPTPVLNLSWVCEYGQSMLARRPVAPLPAVAGDWRLPRVYSYNLAARRLTDRTPNDPNFRTLTGLRSAGSLGRVAFLAGPTFQNDVTFAAWDAGTGSFKGTCRATSLNNIRQWVTAQGVLYAAAGRDSGDGVILRWNGSPDQPFNGAASPSAYCGFEVVGVLPAFPAYVTVYDNKRLAASVWTENRGQPDLAAVGGPYATGVYIGPPFGADGQYTARDADLAWSKIWGPNQYETDPVVAASIGGGAISFWKGWLWFGTVHNNSATTQAHAACTYTFCYGPPQNADEQVDLLFNSSRAVSLWRARLVQGAPAEVQMLYGETELPALVPGTKTWEMKPTGWTPLHGGAGFGNPFITYAWAASAGTDDLLWGVYDYRYTFDVRLGVSISSPPDPRKGYGADLWRFSDPEQAARPETVDGFNDFTNYGVRNMIRLAGSEQVILGTASGFNLEAAAGWELHRLTPPAPGTRSRR